MDIIVYHTTPYHESLEQFRENLLYGKLRHLASELFIYGLNDPLELEQALKRAMQACEAMGIPLSKNFKPVYAFKNGGIIADWRLSSLARKLVMLNADTRNPYVARLQLQLITCLNENA